PAEEHFLTDTGHQRNSSQVEDRATTEERTDEFLAEPLDPRQWRNRPVEADPEAQEQTQGGCNTQPAVPEIRARSVERPTRALPTNHPPNQPSPTKPPSKPRASKTASRRGMGSRAMPGPARPRA